MSHPHNIVLHSRLVEGQGGMPCIRVANELADATIYLNGGHVAHYRPRGAAQPVLWTSGESDWVPGRPIRGGVPLCWPWFAGFGPEGGPGHGVARTARWTWVSSSALAGGATRVELSLEDGLETRRWWPRPFALRLAVTVGRTLDVSLTVRNRSDEAVTWTGALHSYFAVSDARRVQVDGFDGCRYRDRMDDDAIRTQAGAIRFAGETDRIYYGGGPTARIVDPGFRRRIAVTGRGSGSTVVWNPWVEKSARMPDFGADEWPRMCCVETARAPGDECELAPGAAHELGVTIGLE